jgi:ABC-type transporter Mla MlaB component
VSRNETTLKLDGALEIERIASLWAELRQRCRGVTRIDLSAVSDIDSSGVALVRSLQKLASEHPDDVEIVEPPARFAQIGLAHRVEAGGD